MISATADTGADDTVLDGRKVYGKRELSTSKRAAQNRAAQVSTMTAEIVEPGCEWLFADYPNLSLSW